MTSPEFIHQAVSDIMERPHGTVPIASLYGLCSLALVAVEAMEEISQSIEITFCVSPSPDAEKAKEALDRMAELLKGDR